MKEFHTFPSNYYSHHTSFHWIHWRESEKNNKILDASGIHHDKINLSKSTLFDPPGYCSIWYSVHFSHLMDQFHNEFKISLFSTENLLPLLSALALRLQQAASKWTPSGLFSPLESAGLRQFCSGLSDGAPYRAHDNHLHYFIYLLQSWKKP